MQISRETLEATLGKYEQELKGLNSFITELSSMTDKHNTPTEHFEEDLAEAKHNVVYYENQIASIKNQLGKSAGRRSLNREQIVGAVIISSISFAAGLLLGSSWGGKRKN